MTPKTPPTTAATAFVVDMSPVAEPEGLVSVARIAGARRLEAVVKHAFAGLPIGLPGFNEFTQELFGRDAAQWLDARQSIDAAASVYTAPFAVDMAVSIAVSSYDDAKRALSAGHALTPTSAGALSFDLGSPVAAKLFIKKCVLLGASGPTGRIVCGDGPTWSERLAPYLVRTVANTALKTDVHVELRASPLHNFVREKKLFITSMVTSLVAQAGYTSEAATAVANAAGEELVDVVLDLDTVSFDATMLATELNVTMTTRLGGTQSLIAKIIASRADGKKGPPELFWQLPSDAFQAGFSHGVATKDIEHARTLISQLALESGGELGFAPKAVPRLVEAFSRLDLAHPWVHASGGDMAAIAAALRVSNAPGAVHLADQARLSALGGWHLTGVDGNPGLWIDVIKQFVSAWESGRQTRLAWTKRAPFSARIVPVPKKAKLPSGSILVEVSRELSAPTENEEGSKGAKAAASKGGAKPNTVKSLVFAVPASERLWFAVGSDSAVLVEKLQSVIAANASVKTLATRAGLELLRDADLTSGGFTSVNALVRGAIPPEAATPPSAKVRRAVDAIVAAPEQAATPIPYRSTVQADQAHLGGTVYTLRGDVPMPVIEWAVRLLMTQ